MKIYFVLPGLDMSGGNRIVASYAKRLQLRGHHVTVLVAGPRPLPIKAVIKRLIGRRPIASIAPPRSHFDGLALDVRRLAHFGLQASDVPHADVIVGTWWETAAWVAELPDIGAANVYLIQHHEIFDQLHERQVRATYRLPLHKIVVAPWLAEVMASEYGDVDVDIVPNAIDPSEFHACVRDRQSAPTVGFMYASAAFKGISTAIAALRRLDERIPGLRVVSFGRESPEGLEFLGDRLSYTFDPDTQQLRESYSACDAWIMSSISEGFGLPALEAMACRTPVVSTRMGWPQSAVIDGVNGALVPVGDDAALADAVHVVLSLDNAAWQAMSSAAAATAADLNWDQSITLFTAALERARAKQQRVTS